MWELVDSLLTGGTTLAGHAIILLIILARLTSSSAVLPKVVVGSAVKCKR